MALSFGSPRLGVTQHPALWSPDFPLAPRGTSDHLAAFGAKEISKNAEAVYQGPGDGAIVHLGLAGPSLRALSWLGLCYWAFGGEKSTRGTARAAAGISKYWARSKPKRRATALPGKRRMVWLNSTTRSL